MGTLIFRPTGKVLIILPFPGDHFVSARSIQGGGFSWGVELGWGCHFAAGDLCHQWGLNPGWCSIEDIATATGLGWHQLFRLPGQCFQGRRSSQIGADSLHFSTRGVEYGRRIRGRRFSLALGDCSRVARDGGLGSSPCRLETAGDDRVATGNNRG